jgi:hypothetical protein
MEFYGDGGSGSILHREEGRSFVIFYNLFPLTSHNIKWSKSLHCPSYFYNSNLCPLVVENLQLIIKPS